MDLSQLVGEFQSAIVGIYRQEGLTCLRGIDNEYLLNGRKIVKWYFDVTEGPACRGTRRFDYNKNFDDLLFCSDELLYFTANLYLYRPYIDNPLHAAIDTGDSVIYPNYQNIAGKRYNMFADIVSQVAYNYWDRIGDLVGSFFPERIEPDRVYFPTAIDIVPAEFQFSPNFKWLGSFKEEDYQDLNRRRKRVVHYTSSDTDLKHKYLGRVEDRNGIEELQAERESLPEYYKEHIGLTLEGFERTLLLLEEVVGRLPPNTNSESASSE
jgi:hypothetical protein